jgi:hypothetical protein
MNNKVEIPSPLQTPILFLVFNRPDTTAQVYEAIRAAKPLRLYVAADGPRANQSGEGERVNKVREIVTAVDWPCEVKTLFQKENLGCKCAVSRGINWFFEQEKQGIILEDDCLPHPDFFVFCENLLRRYADNEQVWAITGDNFQNGQQRGEGAYYFSRYNHVWGWASWRRAWQQADMEIKFWPVWKNSSDWKIFWTDAVARRYWEKIFNRIHRAEIDTWDYPWTASVWYHGGLTATPNVNLVSNVGFGENSTHTDSKHSPFANMPTGNIDRIKHPASVQRNLDADRYTFDYHYGGINRRFPNAFLSLPRKLVTLTFRYLKKRIM